MKIVCDAELLPSLTTIKSLYSLTPLNFASFSAFREIRAANLVIAGWPTRKSIFWLRISLLLYPSKKLLVFTRPQEISEKISPFDKKFLLRANRIICPNLENARRDSLALIYWRAPEKFREIPQGIDLEKYSQKESYKPSTNETIAKFKAIINFVTKKVIKKGLPSILIICTDQEEWQEIIGNNRLQGNIFYFNQEESDQIKKIKSYQEADILVVTSNQGDSTTNNIIEGLACGLAIIAPRNPNLNNLFSHDQQGLFFKPNDHEDLIEKINLLCGDEEKREKMSRESRKLAENKYNKKQRDLKILQIIKELEK